MGDTRASLSVAPERVPGWSAEPGEHEYEAAYCFLTLVMREEEAHETVQALREAPVVAREAKDLLRASGLDSVPADNRKVAKKLRKLEAGIPLAPVLLVRGRLEDGTHLTIADGFHRICAAMARAPGACIPTKLVDLPSVRRHCDNKARQRLPAGISVLRNGRGH